MEAAADACITIVLPVHNREDIVLRTLDSIAAQTTRQFRLIVVDNGSTDGTRGVVEQWMTGHPEVSSLLLVEPTPGAAAARNCGLQAAQTPWVLFFDSDDVMMPRHIERAIHTISNNPEAEIIVWNVDYTALDGTHTTLRSSHRDHLYCNIFHHPLSTQRYCCRTSLMRSIGGWDPEVMGWNDIEVASRLLQHVSPRQIVHAGAEVTAHVLATPASITGLRYSDNAHRFDASIDKIAAALPPHHRHWAQLKRVILAACCAHEGRRQLGRKLLDKALRQTPSPFRRLLWHAAYSYTAAGGRGISRILRPLM